MKTVTTNRRHVLRGAGATLALPFLPSLYPRRADGAQAVPPSQRFFVAAMTQHGAVGPDSMYPAAQVLANKLDIHPNHTAHTGTLAATAVGANARLSAVMTAPASQLTQRIVSKMNVMRGFDIPYYIGHHTGGHLGNYVRSDQGPQNLTPMATVDQVIAYSPKFYPNLTGNKARSIVTGMDFHGASWGYSNPTAGNGTIQKVAVESNPMTLFDKLFVKSSTPGTPPPTARKLIVDRVLENYRRLRTSNRRLSMDDKQRLDDHVGRMSELETKLSNMAPALQTKACSDFMRPATSGVGNNQDNPVSASAYFKAVNDTVAMAFACGSSRVATIWIHSAFADYSGSWHQDTAHQWEAPAAQSRLVTGLRNTFESAILDLAVKLDSIELFPGTSILDATLYQWTQESGWATHDAQDMPIVTFGAAGGYFKTGQYVDFRSLNANNHLDIFQKQKQFTGLWLRQWQATAAQSMGLAPADFEKNGKTGFGDAYWTSAYDKAVHANVINRASDPVPIVTA
ncbi:MAG: DUF1552 domain-containing protein [Deltaproteobacteria bacterium]|nr:DUF1552 domain-containing protein [Deltaproteobacteria bacterium]